MNTIVQRPLRSGPEPIAASPYDIEMILPLELIREHCKIDDMEGVSDDMLVLYRKVALETAEKYTGLLLTDRRVITEVINRPSRSYKLNRKPTFKHTAKYNFAEPRVHYYGFINQPAQVIPVNVNQKIVHLPRIEEDFGFGCCNPCRTGGTLQIMYVAGYDCGSSMPSAITLGALKYIAHVVENPGDMVRSYSESGSQSSIDASGSNPAIASGAMEIWRSTNDSAI